MLKDPSNLKYRFQYAYVVEKKVQKLFEEEGRKDLEEIKQSSINLNMCKNMYIGLSRLGISDHIRNIDNPDMKDRVKTELSKIRA